MSRSPAPRLTRPLQMSSRFMVFANKATATAANMIREKRNWIEECQLPPPGNGPGECLGRCQPVNGAAVLLT